MGVVEAMQPLESPLASLNGSHSEGRLGKKPMDIGECSYRPKSPKIKRRNVSAVRDFPPGCGRFAHLNNAMEAFAGTSQSVPLEATNELEAFVGAAQSVPIESLVAGDKIGDGDGVEKCVSGDSGQVDDSDSMNVEPIETGTALEDELSDLRVLSTGQVGDSDLMNRAVDTVETVESLTVLEHEVSDLSKNPHQVSVATLDEQMVSVLADRSFGSIWASNVNGLQKTAARRYPPRRNVSAVRDFPPLCGRNASLEARNFGQEQSDMDDKPSSSNRANTIVQQTGEDDVQEEEFHENELGGNVSEVTGGKVQAECKGHPVNEMVVLEDARKNCIEPPQESNGRQGTMGDFGHLEEKVGKQIVVYHEKNSPGGNCQESRVIVLGLMAASTCLWMKGKEVENCKPDGAMSESKQKKPDGGMSGSKRKKPAGMSENKRKKPGGGVSESKQKEPDFKCQPEGSKTTSRTKIDPGREARKTNRAGARKIANQGTGQQLVIRDEIKVLDVIPISCCTNVCPPPFGQGTSSSELCDNGTIVTRNKVRETLRLFQAVYRKLLQEEETKLKERGTSRRRFDLQAAKILKDKGKYVNVGKQILGAVPGVEVGDEFHYRVELNMIGLHRQIQGGIDYVKHGGKILATSIVASGGYANDVDNSNSLIYTGQGGNVIKTEKEPEDQKLERGNLALKNSLHEKNPVRVIRGSDASEGKSRTYVYDGLYLVEKCWQDLGPHNKLVFKFQLDRIGGQSELAWKELKKSKKFQVREGICVDDISGGQESIPICAVNTIDDEKPPSFKYITSVIYPDWCRPLPLKGCSCTSGCSDSETCSCAVKNGGEIPYNFNRAIVEAKPLVYECGPSCKCPPSCHNRVSQYGIKFQLELFKTKSMGWGVRSLNSIPSGSFICEYIGELLEEKEAEARTGNDEYLFDIGNNYNDNSLWDGLLTLMPDAQSSSYEVVEEGCFTIDAAWKGNVGRFINHSCSPNLYAQNVLYDHEDNRIPHIMLFAAENIPPLQELTYHYNYMIDHVRDSNGNIKKKSCYCGSPECTGRLY
ncbi:hypothetical protein M0R45_024868 [Rubus argutus]|uniref:Uncharacterized protein n=1 Tax=Rubus argutus TaxID=59490 RepID=A0AAW1WUE2_RUBAR